MNQIKKDSYGFTLIETITAILLIGLIFIAFLGIFLSSKKIGVASESIIDATYIAQHELESVYQLSKYLNVISLVQNTTLCTSYSTLPTPADSYSCTKNLTNHPKYSIKIEFISSDIISGNFYNVIVSVSENLKLKASMESFYKFPQ